MKKLFVAFLLSLSFIVACQETSSIVAPTNEDSKDNGMEFVPAENDTGSSQDQGRPGFPRV